MTTTRKQLSTWDMGGGIVANAAPGVASGDLATVGQWAALLGSTLHNRGGVASNTVYNPGDVVAYNGQHVMILATVTSTTWSAFGSPPTLDSSKYIPLDGMGLWYASDWGVKGDAGTTDNGILLNRMMCQMWTSGKYGIVVLPPGDLAAWLETSTTVIVPPKIVLQGQGIEGTLLRLGTTKNIDVIQFMQYNSSSQATILSAATGTTVSATSLQNAYYAGIKDMAISGRNWAQASTAYTSSVNMTTNPTSSAAGSDPDFDPTNFLMNVECSDATGDGLTHVGRGQLRVTDCLFRYNAGWGAIPSFDSLYTGNNFAENGIGGVSVAYASCNGANNKSYNNGQNAQWVSGTAYTALTRVMYLGGLYVCISAVTSATVPSSDATHWSHITAATNPTYWGTGFFFDTGGERTWVGCDSQENSGSDFYVKGAAVHITGTCSTSNFNQASSTQNGTNPNNYVALVLDDAVGSIVDLVCRNLASGSMSPLKILNGSFNNTVRMTGDDSIGIATSSDSQDLISSGNNVQWNRVTVLGGSMISTTAGSAGSNNSAFIGDDDGAQFSNFSLADNGYPDTSGKHYWSFSHRSDHSFLFFNFNGTVYKNVMYLLESGIAQFLGVVQHQAGTDTSTTATFGSQTVSSGTAFQPNTTQDSILYMTVKTAASITSVAIGPTSTPANSFWTSAITVGVGIYPFRVPKGWYMKITGTLTNVVFSKISC